MSDSAPAVEARQLTRSFDRRRAVDGVDLTVRPGDALAVFGPNGAGKTTLLRLLAGLLKPTSGSVHIGGESVRGDGAARAKVGFISHQSLLYPALTARENVELAGSLYGVPQHRQAALQALEALQIGDRADAIVRSLSRGMQQRVSIARAIVHGPRSVLLDEPYTGLDAIGAAALTSMLRELRASGAALVLVTHNVGEGLAMASHAAIMIEGRIARHEPCADVDPAAWAARYHDLLVRPPEASRVGRVA
jgi:heme exporter protein A